MAKRSHLGPLTAWSILLAAIAATIVAVIGGGWLLRYQIVARVSEERLATLGLTDARVTVAEVATDRLILTDIAADDTDAVTIRRLEAAYSLQDLIRLPFSDDDALRPLKTITIDRPRIILTETADGVDLGPIRTVLDRLNGAADTVSGGAANRKLLVLPLTSLRINDGRVLLDRGHGVTTLNIAGTITGGPELTATLAVTVKARVGDLALDLTLTETAPRLFQGAVNIASGKATLPGLKVSGLSGMLTLADIPGDAHSAEIAAMDIGGTLMASSATLGRFPFEPVTVDLTADKSKVAVEVTASNATNSNMFTAVFNADAPADGATYSLNVNGTLTDTMTLADRPSAQADAGNGARQAPHGALTGGSGILAASLRGSLPPLAELGGMDALSALRMAQSGKIDIELTGLDSPGIGSGLGVTGGLNLRVESGGRSLSVEAAAPLRLTAQRLSPRLVATAVEALGLDGALPPAVAALLTEGTDGDPPISVTLDSPGLLPGLDGLVGGGRQIPFGLKAFDDGAILRADLDAAVAIDLRERMQARVAFTGQLDQTSGRVGARGDGTEAADSAPSDLTAAGPTRDISIPAFHLTAAGSPADAVSGIDLAVTGRFATKDGAGSAEVAATAAAGRIKQPEAAFAVAAATLGLRYAIDWIDGVADSLTATAVEPLHLAAARLDLSNVRIDGLNATLPVDLSMQAGPRLRLRNAGRVAAVTLRLPDGIRSRGGLSFSLAPMPSAEATATDGGPPLLALESSGTLSAAAAVKLAPLTIRLPGDTGGLRASTIDGWLRLNQPAKTDGPGLLRVVLADGRVGLPKQRIGLTGIDLDVSVPLPADTDAPPLAPTVTLVVDELRDNARPETFAPASLSLSAAPQAGQPGVVDMIASVIARNGAFAVTLDGSHDFATDSGSARLSMEEVRLGRGGIPLTDLSPRIGRDLPDISGGVDLGGTIAWTGGNLTSDVGLVLRDLNLGHSGFTLTKLNTAVQIDRVSPLRTRPDQKLAIAAIDAGIPLTNAMIRFRLTEGTRLALGDSSLQMAGGEVKLGDFVVDLDNPDSSFVLRVKDVDVDELLSITELKGLVASGRLHGEIPIRVTSDSVEVRDGKLSTTGGGAFSYQPDAPPPGLASGGESVQLMLEALQNFQYEALDVSLNRAVDGDTAIKLRLEGSNPDFYDGYPVLFNLNLSGKLDRIIRSSLRNYGTPAEIRALQQRYAED